MSSLAKRLVLMIALTVALAGGRHAAGQSGAQQRLTPGEIRWPAGGSSLIGTSGASGIQTVTLKGDPTKPGVYALLLRAGPNTRIQSHAHPDDRVATVVSGTWYFGYGREFDEKALKALPPGSFYTEPPGMNHFAMTKGEAVVIQITGYGPSGTTYVDPRNDPTKKP
jgi:quercetin dioxygenase-like cupin family protein